MERLGVMLCTGCGIGDGLDIEALASLAGRAGRRHDQDPPGALRPGRPAAASTRRSRRTTLDGVLIAACSHRAKIEEFSLDRDGVAVERVSLREQVVWSHPAGEEDTQMLAEDLVRMGCAQAGQGRACPSRWKRRSRRRSSSSAAD